MKQTLTVNDGRRVQAVGRPTERGEPAVRRQCQDAGHLKKEDRVSGSLAVKAT